jgi:hypothetical protein
MKSIIMSFWLMTIAGGHFLVAAFTNLNRRFVYAQGASEFLFYAVLMLVVAGIFVFLATRYGADGRDKGPRTKREMRWRGEELRS